MPQNLKESWVNVRLYGLEGQKRPMRRILTDDEISNLIEEEKPLPENWQTRLKLRSKARSSHRQRDLAVKGVNGNVFRIVMRQSTINPLDFSVILVFQDETGASFRLCRYNGKHPSEHTNRVEKSRRQSNARFRNEFHIHMATERYQQEGYDLDGYAEVTRAYSSFESALDEFLTANSFQCPEEDLPLFDNQGGSR